MTEKRSKSEVCVGECAVCGESLKYLRATIMYYYIIKWLIDSMMEENQENP